MLAIVTLPAVQFAEVAAIVLGLFVALAVANSVFINGPRWRVRLPIILGLWLPILALACGLAALAIYGPRTHSWRAALAAFGALTEGGYIWWWLRRRRHAAESAGRRPARSIWTTREPWLTAAWTLAIGAALVEWGEVADEHRLRSLLFALLWSGAAAAAAAWPGARRARLVAGLKVL